MAQESIVGGLFGVSPEEYDVALRQQELKTGAELAKLTPTQLGEAQIYAGGAGLGRVIGGALGAQDPTLQKITAVNQVAQNIDYSDPRSIVQGVKILSRIDPQSAIKLQNYAVDLMKNMQPQKLTGDERYIQTLQLAENFARSGKEMPPELLSQANMAAQMLSKPRSFFDQASGQTVTIPATDPSKAFPNVFKQFEGTTTAAGGEVIRPSAPTTGAATTQQVTAGNLPSTSQQKIADIDSQLKEIENRAPQLQKFLTKIESGDVKYDLASNSFDIAGAILPPIWGGKEIGNQVDKDEIQRALTARVNSVLNAAKGVQAKDDAQRAKDQIASPSTYLSSARMAGAIKDLQKAEKSYSEELNVEKTTLLGQGRTPSEPSKPSVPKAPTQPSVSSDEAKIQRYIDFNKGKPTREDALRALRAAGVIKGE